jgi:hypothetical protein
MEAVSDTTNASSSSSVASTVDKSDVSSDSDGVNGVEKPSFDPSVLGSTS